MTASTTSLTPSLQVSQAPPLRPARDSFWTRIAAELAEAIGSGVYPPGQRLPSEHALAEQFGVNRHTIRRSLASLCSQGLVRITQGSGTYVEDFAVDLVLGKRTRHQQGLAQAGLRGSLVLLQAQTTRATVKKSTLVLAARAWRSAWVLRRWLRMGSSSCASSTGC